MICEKTIIIRNLTKTTKRNLPRLLTLVTNFSYKINQFELPNKNTKNSEIIEQNSQIK